MWATDQLHHEHTKTHSLLQQNHATSDRQHRLVWQHHVHMVAVIPWHCLVHEIQKIPHQGSAVHKNMRAWVPDACILSDVASSYTISLCSRKKGICDQVAHLLSLFVKRVVVSSRQGIRAHQDAPLHLLSQSLPSTQAIHIFQ